MENPFLGRGWSFPPTFDNKTKRLEMVDSEEDINQSLSILLSTSLGERVMRPEYGCNLKDFQFEPMNVSMIGFIKNLIERAILFYEPRIKAEKITITESTGEETLEGKLKISIDYFIRSTNSRYNFVYDFYLKEGIKQPQFKTIE